MIFLNARNTSVAIASLAMLGACATDGQYNTTAKDAAIAGAVGAAAGAVIAGEGNRAKGAVIGGAIGAAAGAAYGCSRDNICPWSDRNPNQSQLYYDSVAQRRYFIDKKTGDTFWESGEFRAPAR